MQRTLRIILTSALLAASAASTAGAAERVSLRDVDLSSARGAAMFKARVDAAARRVCLFEGRQDLSSASRCRQAAWAEVEDQLSGAQLRAYAAASTAKPVQMAAVAAR